MHNTLGSDSAMQMERDQKKRRSWRISHEGRVIGFRERLGPAARLEFLAHGQKEPETRTAMVGRFQEDAGLFHRMAVLLCIKKVSFPFYSLTRVVQGIYEEAFDLVGVFRFSGGNGLVEIHQMLGILNRVLRRIRFDACNYSPCNRVNMNIKSGHHAHPSPATTISLANRLRAMSQSTGNSRSQRVN
jgi:hypothetical protein